VTGAVAGALTQEMTGDGILVLTLDVPGEKVNTLSRALLGEMDALITRLETRDDVRGIVLRSGKPDGFIAGADIKDFTAIRTALEAEALSREGQALLGRLAALRAPVVAAIHGPCLGGGLEAALACRYRVASFEP
jgi:3-hydroxyacyl-CoA dehydrogenase/enoyl-CoA hydratase/3-hydroxybutyryl-CoA epimerase